MTAALQERIRVFSGKGAAWLHGYARRSPVISRFAPRLFRLMRWTLDLPGRLRGVYAIRRNGLPVMTAMQGDHVIYVNPLDERGRQLVKKHGNLNPPSLRMWRRLLEHANWTDVVDIGANYGEMLVGLHLPPEVEVTAVEPNPQIASYLERTLRETGRKVRIVRGAISEETGTATLLIDRKWSGTSRFASLQRGKLSKRYEPISVPTMTLDALLKTKNLKHVRAAIKIDIEGYELPVLRSALPTLNELSHFNILMEILFVTPEDLSWLFQNFSVQVYDLSSDSFVKVPKSMVEEMIDSPSIHPNYYRNDVVLGRRE